jgi:HlyD family secretion protein
MKCSGPVNCSFTFLFILMVIIFTGCSSGKNKTKVIQRDITESVYASGIIKAVDQYEVFAASAGIIKKILVKENDSVSAGQTILVIDNTISELNSENAKINAELLREQSGNSSAILMELETKMRVLHDKFLNDSILFTRQQRLWEQQVGAKVELEKRELAFKSSQAEYQSALLQYRQLKSELEKKYRQAVNTLDITQKQQSDLSVSSAVSGIVYDILKEPGEFISSQTPLAVIGAAGKFEIELQVDEFDIVKVKSGQRVFLTMDSYRNNVFEGTINLVEPIMNQRTRTFTVHASFINAPGILYPNLTVEANIVVNKKENALVIPAAYLLPGNKVILTSGDTATVETGIESMEWIEIVKGLGNNQEILLPSGK